MSIWAELYRAQILRGCRIQTHPKILICILFFQKTNNSSSLGKLRLGSKLTAPGSENKF